MGASSGRELEQRTPYTDMLRVSEVDLMQPTIPGRDDHVLGVVVRGEKAAQTVYPAELHGALLQGNAEVVHKKRGGCANSNEVRATWHRLWRRPRAASCRTPSNSRQGHRYGRY